MAGFFIKDKVVEIKIAKHNEELVKQGDDAVNSGDLLKAYKLFSEAGSDKKYELTDKVIGNSPANIINSGLLAEDDENIYFIASSSSDSMYSPSETNLIKENKATKEKQILTDSAVSHLNVVGDYVYFINNEQKPCRITKDGKEIKVLFDSVVYNLSVVGNEMYYIKVDYENPPENLTEEQLKTLASQGQIKSYPRIHRMNVDTMKDELITEEASVGFSVYGDSVYYFSDSDSTDTWAMFNLKAINLKTKEITVLVDTPVNTFFVKGNNLYYIATYKAELKGQTIDSADFLDCSLYKMNLDSKISEKISIDNVMFTNLNILGDTLLYIGYDRDSYMNYSSGADENAAIPTADLATLDLNTNETKIILSGNAQLVNACSNDVFVELETGGTARLNLDGTVFEPVYADGTSIPQIEETQPEVPEVTE